MKTILVGINAKYSHSNLAIRYIKEYSKRYYDLNLDILEFTINQSDSFILSEIYKTSPDIVAFSCYIWNFELVKKLSSQIKKILPQAKIIFGGPEVSYNPHISIQNNYCDFVCCGEGEETFPSLIMTLKQSLSLSDLVGVCYKENDNIIHPKPASAFIDMDKIPFVYDSIDDLQNKIIYYESSRGCPFSCQYCLSSRHEKVRFLSFDKVCSQLDFFLKNNVRQVKFVDRTFNCKKSHAMAIWQYLIENDNGVTNFHFEIAAELIDDDMLNLVKKARKGFFQFEIGVQSTNPQTLVAIERITDINKLNYVVTTIKSQNNIHLHLDLIVGLPFESYEIFKKSFNDVYNMLPDQFQVGFLKLLCGSGLYLNQEKYNIVCSDFAPYEVLSTNELSYAEILKLKSIEHLIDTYYNSNRFMRTLKYMLSFFDTPFDMYEQISAYYDENDYNKRPHSFMGMYTMLYDFFNTITDDKNAIHIFKWLIKADLYSHDKIKSLPQWLDVSLSEEYKTKIFDFLDNSDNIQKYLPEYLEFNTKQIYRQVQVEVFPFDIDDIHCNKTIAILYNYKNCDILGNSTQYKITL